MDKLSTIKKGTKVKIVNVLNSDYYLKLIEMGFLPGEQIYIENIAPMGDPISINLNNSIVCLRLVEAAHILVEKM